MDISLNGMQRFWNVALALIAMSAMVACTTDDDDLGSGTATDTTGDDSNADDSTSSGGSEPDDTSASDDSSSGSASSDDTVCAESITLDAATPGIADFDGYNGGENLADWSFALGGDSAVGVYSGPFGYGDDHVDDAGNEVPETFDLVDGNDSTYGLRIYDSEADDYGGGMGLWLSACLDASAFDGISFWVRGTTPKGDAKLSLLMEETTPEADGDSVGACPGSVDECTHPSTLFPVTDEWTEIQLAWSDFTAGNAAGSSVAPDGTNIWQIQFDVELNWEDDGSGEYVPVPSEYEFVVDDLSFY